MGPFTMVNICVSYKERLVDLCPTGEHGVSIRAQVVLDIKVREEKNCYCHLAPGSIRVFERPAKDERKK